MPQEEEGTPNGAPNDPPPEPPKSFSQEDVNRFLARERKKFEEEMAQRPTAEQLSEVQAQLRKLTEEREMAGKTEVEKLQVQHTREMEKLNHKFQQLAEESKAKDEAVHAAQTTLRTERMSRAFGAALTKAEVYGSASSDALRVLMGEVKDVDIDDKGTVRASYGEDLIDEPPEAIAKKFLEDRPYFASAKLGGAGTSPPTNRSAPKGVQDMTQDQCWEAAGQDPSIAPQPR